MRPGYQPHLSVLIATLKSREPYFMRLLDHLLPQCEKSPAPVEVVALQNSGQHSLAAYRQRLLDDARGLYLAYVDDDDFVSDDYVDTIVRATTEYNEDMPDVVCFPQFCVGTLAPLTMFGLGFEGQPWEVVLVHGMPAYLRTYSHVLPTLSEVAKQGTFTHPDAPGHTYEDQIFAHSIVPILKERGSREARLTEPLYCYAYGAAGPSTQDGPQPEAVDPVEYPEVPSECFRWCGQ